MDKPTRSPIAQTYDRMSYTQERAELALAQDMVEWGAETAGVLTPISVKFSRGMTRCMGKFSGKKLEIRLSHDLWLRATPEEREETVYHELAHGIDWLRNGSAWRKGSTGKRLIHDRVFKAICHELGQQGDRCHKVDTSGLGRRQSRRRAWMNQGVVLVQTAVPASAPVRTPSSRPTKADFKVGDQVYFGRRNGEKTLGVIVRLNPKKAKVRQLEARGVHKTHSTGTEWGVPYSLLTKA